MLYMLEFKMSLKCIIPSSWIQIRLPCCRQLAQNLMFWLFFSSFLPLGWLKSWRRGSQTSQMSPPGLMSLRSSAGLQLRRECRSHHFLFPHYLVLTAQYVKSTSCIFTSRLKDLRVCNSAFIIWSEIDFHVSKDTSGTFFTPLSSHSVMQLVTYENQ